MQVGVGGAAVVGAAGGVGVEAVSAGLAVLSPRPSCWDWPEGPESGAVGFGAVLPGVVAGEVDVFPAERGEVLEQLDVDGLVCVERCRSM